MKKRIIISASISFVIAILFLFLNSDSKFIKCINLELASIEALAQGEGGGSDWWYQPDTRRCQHNLGGGWFESSVETVCIFCSVPYSCSPRACGE